MAGDKSAEKSYLSETISADDHSNRYFYVFPNDNTGGNATLITLVGTYDGQLTYFPFRINDKPGEDGATSDGTFIQRNHVYTVNVTLKRLGGGSADPGSAGPILRLSRLPSSRRSGRRNLSKT